MARFWNAWLLPAARFSRTLACMTAWLVAEGGQQLVRADRIVSVAAVPVQDRWRDWGDYHPEKRLVNADDVQIMAGTRTGADLDADHVCVLVCPGRSAQDAVAELLVMLDAASASNRVQYVHGPWPSWRGRPDPIWRVADTPPGLGGARGPVRVSWGSGQVTSLELQAEGYRLAAMLSPEGSRSPRQVRRLMDPVVMFLGDGGVERTSFAVRVRAMEMALVPGAGDVRQAVDDACEVLSILRKKV